MTQWKLRAFFAIAVVFIIGVWWRLGQEHAAIDACLDGGGRWDYDAEVCEGG